MYKGIKTFRGGYSFTNYEGQAKPIIADCPIPSQVIIPLRQGFSNALRPMVGKGDKVAAGQIIGRDDNVVSSPVHSSVNGIVEDIKQIEYFKHDIYAVFIRTTDFSKEIPLFREPVSKWWKLSNEEIEEAIYLSGVGSLDREGIPTRFKSSVIGPNDVKHLIIHAVESEPYHISLDLILAGKNFQNFVEGIKILAKIMPNCKINLTLNVHRKKIAGQLLKLSKELSWLDIYLVNQKYPQGYDEVLVPTILNQKFIYGYSAANSGVIILSIPTVLSVFEAVVMGRPYIERIMALSGPNMKENIHMKVRFGTPVSEVLSGRLKENIPSRIIINSLLTGFQLKDFKFPIDKKFSQIIAIPEKTDREFLPFLSSGKKSDSFTNTFLAKILPVFNKLPDTNIHGEKRPCISCGFCEDVCPVRIIPHLLYKYINKGIIDETLKKYEIFNCINCCLCSYVCPSKIPLFERIKEGQEKLLKQGCDRDQCDLPHFDIEIIEEYRGATRL